MPTIITRGASSARGFGFGAGAGGYPAVPETSINIANSTLLGSVDLVALGICGPSGILGPDDNPYVMTVSDNGLYVFLNSYASSIIYRFNMAVPYDITTLSATITDQVNVGVTGMMGGFWNTTGTKFNLRAWSGGPMYTWDTSNWSLSSFSGTSVGGPSSTSYVVAVNNTGVNAYTGNPSNTDALKRYDAGSPWQSFSSSSSASYNVGQSGNIYCTFPSGGNRRLFSICDDINLIAQTDMPSFGDLNGATAGPNLNYSSYPRAFNGRNTMGVMVSNNSVWYMLAQRAPANGRYITWWKTGSY